MELNGTPAIGPLWERRSACSWGCNRGHTTPVRNASSTCAATPRCHPLRPQAWGRQLKADLVGDPWRRLPIQDNRTRSRRVAPGIELQRGCGDPDRRVEGPRTIDQQWQGAARGLSAKRRPNLPRTHSPCPSLRSASPTLRLSGTARLCPTSLACQGYPATGEGNSTPRNRALSQTFLTVTEGEPATNSSPWQRRKRAREATHTANRALPGSCSEGWNVPRSCCEAQL